MINNPNQFSREAWDANAEHWDSRMGDEGNDFFNETLTPCIFHCYNNSSSKIYT
jgi:hypothetical protein